MASYKVKISETLTGDSRVVYTGEDKKAALTIYENSKKELKDCEIEFFKEGKLKFWHEAEGTDENWCK